MSSCGQFLRPTPRQHRLQIRAPEHHEGDQVVDVAEAVALPDGHLDLVVHRLDPRVGDAELYRPEYAPALPADLSGQLHEARYPASARPREPAVQRVGGLAGARPEDRPQALLEQVGPPQRRGLAAGEVLGVLEQREPQPLHRRGGVGLPAAPRGPAQLPPGLAPEGVEGLGRPGDRVERVDGQLGARQPLGEGVGDPGRPVGRDHLDRLPLPVGQQVEELVEPVLAVAPAGPHDPPAVVVHHDGHVPLAPLVARLVDADPAQPVEPAAAVGLLQRRLHARAYAAHGVPVDAGQLGQGAAAHVQRQPGDPVLEGRGEPARGAPRPGDGGGARAVLRAAGPDGGVLQVAAGGAEVGRPPAPGPEPVVGGASPPAHRAPRRRPPGPHGDDYGIALDSHSLDHGALEPERPFE